MTSEWLGLIDIPHVFFSLAKFANCLRKICIFFSCKICKMPPQNLQTFFFKLDILIGASREPHTHTHARAHAQQPYGVIRPCSQRPSPPPSRGSNAGAGTMCREGGAR